MLNHLGRDDRIFSILPTDQYVWINHTATFVCATDNPDYTVYFYTPTITAQLFNTPLPGGGDMVTATFKATLGLNLTSVTCAALDENLSVHSFVSAKLYVQGI